MADMAADLSRPYRVIDGSKFRLKDFDPADRAGVKDKERAQDGLRRGVERLCELQDMLYAQDCYGWGYKSVDILLNKITSGKDPENARIIDPLTRVTKENVKEFGKKWDKWLGK